MASYSTVWVRQGVELEVEGNEAMGTFVLTSSGLLILTRRGLVLNPARLFHIASYRLAANNVGDLGRPEGNQK